MTKPVLGLSKGIEGRAGFWAGQLPNLGWNIETRVTIDSNICHGRPCIRGLRYPVEVIRELLSSGMSIDEVLEEYKDLEHEDILATLAFAARLVQVKRIRPHTA